MEQVCQPHEGQEIQGTGIQASDAEILAAVRKVLTAEVVTHPDVEQAETGRSGFWKAVPKPERAPVSEPTLVSRLLGRLRG